MVDDDGCEVMIDSIDRASREKERSVGGFVAFAWWDFDGSIARIISVKDKVKVDTIKHIHCCLAATALTLGQIGRRRATYTTICLRPSRGLRMNLRVRRVTGESESAILVSCGRVDDQDREVQRRTEERLCFF